MNTRSDCKPRRILWWCVPFVLAVGAGPGAATAADRATCQAIATLLKAADKGLEDTALGQAGRSPTNAIATSARHAQEFADQFSTRDPLPDEVSAALVAIAEAASAQFFIADAAPAFLEHGQVIQQLMPEICPDSEVPDLSRHGN